MRSAAVTRLIDATRRLSARTPVDQHGQTLADAVRTCLDAAAVTLAVGTPTALRAALDAGPGAGPDGGRPEYQSGAASVSTVAIPLELGGRPIGELKVGPPDAARRLRDWPELLTTVRLLVSELLARHAADDADRTVRRGMAALSDARLRAAGDMESQRYQLERDLHDGAQHHMVALRMSLALVEHQLETGDREAAARQLDRLKQLLASTGEVLHSTATGLLSLPLADHGLVTALTARLATLDTLTVDIDPLLAGRRYPPEVEATVYLACLEAVSNAHKHAPGAAVTLALRASGPGLAFAVTDTGPGFDVHERAPLRQMAARLATVGGTLMVQSSPGAGTRVSGFVPV